MVGALSVAAASRPASTNEGHFIAQGNTAEKAFTQAIGLKQIGQPTDRPWDRVNAEGYVARKDGDYSDAIDVKKFPAARPESYGTISTDGTKYVGSLARYVCA